ncbi:hypothetical protein Q5424_25650, partial [Conexibacter sp. JD483]|uniref:hypothetical protein n=2 Tax=unclassified Conexibacter TaxID=2627773 RepID=UPI00286FC936
MRTVLRIVRRHQIALWAALVASLAVAGTAFAVGAVRSASSAERRIYACVAGASGTMRVTSEKRPCRSGERKIAWNQRGAAGAVGPSGAPGAAGAPGAVGPAGPAGP